MTPHEEQSIIRGAKHLAGFSAVVIWLALFDWGPLAVLLLWYIAFVKK